MNVNKMIILGHLGSDPKKTSNDEVVAFSVATNSNYKDEKHTQWHNVVAFGKRAQFAWTYLRKGDMVYVEGPVKTSSWAGDDGKERQSMSVMCNELIKLSGNKKEDPGGNGYSGTSKVEINDEDIPF